MHSDELERVASQCHVRDVGRPARQSSPVRVPPRASGPGRPSGVRPTAGRPRPPAPPAAQRRRAAPASRRRPRRLRPPPPAFSAAPSPTASAPARLPVPLGRVRATAAFAAAGSPSATPHHAAPTAACGSPVGFAISSFAASAHAVSLPFARSGSAFAQSPRCAASNFPPPRSRPGRPARGQRRHGRLHLRVLRARRTDAGHAFPLRASSAASASPPPTARAPPPRRRRRTGRRQQPARARPTPSRRVPLGPPAPSARPGDLADGLRLAADPVPGVPPPSS